MYKWAGGWVLDAHCSSRTKDKRNVIKGTITSFLTNRINYYGKKKVCKKFAWVANTLLLQLEVYLVRYERQDDGQKHGLDRLVARKHNCVLNEIRPGLNIQYPESRYNKLAKWYACNQRHEIALVSNQPKCSWKTHIFAIVWAFQLVGTNKHDFSTDPYTRMYFPSPCKKICPAMY